MTEKLDLLAQLLPDDDLRRIAGAIQALREPLGSGTATLPGDVSLDLDTSNRTVQLFDQPFNSKGTISGHAAFLGVDAKVDPFATGARQPLRAGYNTGQLALDGQLTLDAELPVLSSGSGLRLSARAGASGTFRYRHFYAAPANWRRGRAFDALVIGARLPHLLDLSTPPAHGEVHRLDTKLSLDFGLDFKDGYETAESLAVELAEDLSLPIRTSFGASLRAALGLGLYEDLSLTVGRTAQRNEGWVRVRLQRRRERRLSFSATFSLDLHFDLGTGLAQLFEEATNQVPSERLLRASRQIARYADPAKLEAEASAGLREVLDDLVGTRVVDALDDIVPFAREVVDTFDSLEPRVRSLWDRVLSKADLGHDGDIRAWLTALAALPEGGLDLDTLLHDEKARTWLLAIETITGKSLEEIVLADTGLDQTLADVAAVATRALALLDHPADSVIGRVRRFVTETGIARTVDTLRTLSSPEQIATTVSTRIQSLAAQLAGKAVDRLNDDDLTRIRDWADKIAGLLDPTDPDGTADRLRQTIIARLHQLRLDEGLSIGIEIERVSRETALLDIELDPSGKHKAFRRKVSRALRLGRARDVLGVLADASRMVERSGRGNAPDPLPPKTAAPLPFTLRESAFTSERVRTSAVSQLLDLAGLGKLLRGKKRGYSRRIEQSTLRIHENPDVGDTRFRRSARHVAGYQRGIRTQDLETESAIWLVCHEAGDGLDLDAPYTGTRDASLRLTFSWQGEDADDRELDALFRLLGQLGFAPTGAGPQSGSALASRGRGVRLALAIQFPETTLDPVLAALRGSGGPALWRRAFLNATYRWLVERFVETSRLPGDARNRRNLGQVMSTILVDAPQIRDWLADGDFFARMATERKTGIEVDLDNGPRVVFPIGEPTAAGAAPLTGMLVAINQRTQHGLGWLRPSAAAWDATERDRAPRDYERLLRTFSNGWHDTSIATLRWPNSMFALWLWLALVNVTDASLLRTATGLATLRWRREEQADSDGPHAYDQGEERGDAPFSEPMFWRLQDGVGVPDNLGRAAVFPIG